MRKGFWTLPESEWTEEERQAWHGATDRVNERFQQCYESDLRQAFGLGPDQSHHESPSGRRWKVSINGVDVGFGEVRFGWARDEETEMPGPEGKTWAGWKAELAETFRKWGVATWTVISLLKPAQTTRRTQSREESAVCVGFTLRGKLLQITVRREDRAIDNLALIAKSLEEMRLAEVRGQTDVLLTLYRQLYPEPQRTPPPPQPAPRVAAQPSGPYAALCIAQGAPLEVAEAAYRALSKRYHPDAGGSTDKMQSINVAIAAIRKEHGR